jgi:outer membrane protein assembly factor BamB
LFDTFRFADRGSDIPGGMTTEAEGNFYLSASTKLTPHASGFAVLKYNANTKLQGTFRDKLLPGEFQGAAQAVKLDMQNSVYAIGNTNLSGLVVSLTPGGAQRWTAQFDVEPIALAADKSGNIYVAGNGSAGESDGAGPILDSLLVKYSNTGRVLWEQRHTGTPGQDSRVKDIQLDPSGDPIKFDTTSNNAANLTNSTTVAKFDPSGDLLWAKDFPEPQTLLVAGGLAIDHAGNVYTTSMTNPPEGIARPITVRQRSSTELDTQRLWD